MRSPRSLLLLTAVSALVGAGALLLWRGPEPGGIDDLYTAAFGPADLGPVDFASLSRRKTPNDALACPPDLCRGTPVDFVPPVYPVSGEALRRIVAEVAAQEPRTELVYSARWDEEDRYVVRSRLMRFPDTVVVRIVGRGESGATLAIYSRSQIGYSDLGVNRRRVERWLDGIAARTARP